MEGPVKSPNRTGWNVCNRNFQPIQGSLQLARTVALDKVAYENEAKGVKSLKIQSLSRCNEGTVVEGPVKNPNRTGLNICNRNFQPIQGSL